MEASGQQSFLFFKKKRRKTNGKDSESNGKSPTFNGCPCKWAKSFQATFNTYKKDS